MSKTSEAVKRWRSNTKERIVNSLGGKCCICGYNKCFASLAPHHLDPTIKEFSFGAIRGNPTSWNRIVKELRKCVLVCSNCHGEIHAGVTSIPVSAPKFDELYVTYKPIANLMDKCPVCNGPKPIINTSCSYSCSGKLHRRVEWDKIDLAAFYAQGMSQIAIGELLGVSDAAVFKRARKLGLK